MSVCDFSIVVPTFRRPVALSEMLASVAAFSARDPAHGDYELIVVDDNGADAETAEVLSDFTREHRGVTLCTQERLGAAAARNAGARRASGRRLLFIDDDMIVAPDHLERHRRAHEVVGAGALISGRWEFVPHVHQALARTPFGRFRLQLEQGFQTELMGQPVGDGLVEMELLGAADLSVDRELFWRLGGFDAAFPVAGAEDQDLSLRAAAAGSRLVLDTGNLCLHNDDRADLDAYCRRERRSAQTMPFLAVKHPARFGDSAYVRENRPLAHGDRTGLVLKKLAKSALSRPPALGVLVAGVRRMEAAGAPVGLLERGYRMLLGLHLFLGFRDTWAQAQVEAQTHDGVYQSAGAEPSSPAVTATLVLHNSDAHLSACLTGLQDDVGAGRLEVLAVDNASPDRSAELLAAQLPAAELIRAGTNLGFAAGANLSWPAVHTRYWLLLNPDVVLDPGALMELVAFMDRHPQVALASPWLRGAPDEPLRYPGRPLPSLGLLLIEMLRLHRILPRRLRATLLQGAYVQSPADLDGISETGWIPGTAMIARRDALLGGDPFDERFFMYGEDLELCWRLRRGGWEVAVCPVAGATHIESSSARRAWSEAAVAQRMAAEILAACTLMRSAAFARAYGRLMWLAYSIEAVRRRGGDPDSAPARLAVEAWARAVKGA